jgi:cellulose biosynthesis protein BcsQ
MTDMTDMTDSKSENILNKEKDHIQKKKKYECSICCSIRTRILSCPYCSYISCIECNEKYSLETINKPHCMSCKKEFSNQFFYDNFSKVFINKKYKNHRQQILFEREKYLLPATQPEVEKIYKKERLYKQITDIRKLINDLKIEENQVRDRIYNIDSIKYDEKDEKDEKYAYICPCPNNECRGFLSTRYKCGICNIQACSECREIKKQNHICDPNILESVKEIKKTTRDCPNCRTLIFKISGCDQMYCTQCHIAFSWRTGKVEKGMIHNPHYFEYLRENGNIPRNPNEDRCGGLPTIWFLNNIEFRVYLSNPVFRFNNKMPHKIAGDLISQIYREVRHLREIELTALPTALDNQTNLDLRVSFLLKEINEDDFKVKLQRREKERSKKLEYREVLDMYVNVMQDLFYELQQTKNIEKFIVEEENVRSYVDRGVLSINQKYNSKLRTIEGIFTA